MYCKCNPRLDAIKRKVVKPGPNCGREFYVCPVGQCDYFEFEGSRSNYKYSTSNNNTSHVSTKHSQLSLKPPNSSDIIIKFTIEEFEAPWRIWFGVSGAFPPDLISFFKTISPSQKKMNQKKKIWCFDFDIYEDFVCTLLSSKFSNISVQELPKFLVEGLRMYLRKRKDCVSAASLNLDDSFLGLLLPFQLEGIRFVVDRDGRALIGDEMGCGKTIQAIGVLQHYRNYWPALILMPPNLLQQWETELRKFLGDSVDERDICSVLKGSDPVYGKIVLVPYSILDKVVEKKSITPEMFQVVIADESHNLKNKDSKRSNVAVPFLRIAKVALCLTGTPATNRPVELFSQLNALLPYVFNDYNGFIRRYCDAKPNQFHAGLDVRGSSNERELNLLLVNMVMIRRLKSEVINTLPVKQREIRYVHISKEDEKKLKDIQSRSNSIEKSLHDKSKDSGTLHQLKLAQKALLIENYQATGMAKIPAIRIEIERLIRESRRRTYENVCQNPRDDDAVEDIEFFKDVEETTCSRSSDFVSDEYIVDSDNEVEVVASTAEKSKRKPKGRLIRANASLLEPRKDVRERDESDCEAEIDIFFDDESLIPCQNDLTDTSMTKSKIVDTNHKKTSVTKTKKDNICTPQRIGQKIIVFAHHCDVLDAIETCIQEMRVQYVRINGGLSANVRNSLIDRFQNDDETEIALLSITACGTGLNLTQANVALFAELYWSPGVVLQAEDRIHRLGQKSNSVRIIYLIAQGSADNIIWDQIQKKHSVLGATVGIADSSGYGMSIDKKQAMIETSQSTLDCFLGLSQACDLPTSQQYDPTVSTDSYREKLNRIIVQPTATYSNHSCLMKDNDPSYNFSSNSSNSHHVSSKTPSEAELNILQSLGLDLESFMDVMSDQCNNTSCPVPVSREETSESSITRSISCESLQHNMSMEDRGNCVKRSLEPSEIENINKKIRLPGISDHEEPIPLCKPRPQRSVD